MDEAQRTEVFRDLYETAYPRVLGYALRRTLTPEDAADVVAETFLTAWRRFDELPSGEGILPWLYGVAHRQLANQRRGELRKTALSERLARELEALAPGSRDPLPSDLAGFASAWRRLRPQDRELLGLVVWEDLSHDQLARLMSWPRELVRLRVHRARRRLAAELAKQGIELGAARARASRRTVPAADAPALLAEAGASCLVAAAPAIAPGLQAPPVAGRLVS